MERTRFAKERDTGNLLAALVHIAEAIEDGDVNHAYAIASAAAEQSVVNRCSCGSCGARFEWPGLLDAHRARGCLAEQWTSRLARSAA